jgi:hypothetical protein
MCNPVSIIRSSSAGWVAQMPPTRLGQYPRAQPINPSTPSRVVKNQVPRLLAARNVAFMPGFVVAWQSSVCGPPRCKTCLGDIVVLTDPHRP